MQHGKDQLRTPGLGVKEIVLAVKPNASFDEIVEHLKIVLTVPELPGVRGCSPCFSGLDRFIAESEVLQQIR